MTSLTMVSDTHALAAFEKLTVAGFTLELALIDHN
jgi:hypothetical protein